MSFGKPRNHGCRISDAWALDGMRTVILENELLRVVILCDKGSDIVEFRYKTQDLDFLLAMPGGVRNPGQGVLSAPSSGAFLDYYEGGWNDILPNGGPLATYRGAPLGQHGEISLIPWEHAIIADSPERVAVRLWVRPVRTPFLVEKTVSLEPGRAVLHIEEQVTNEGGEPLDLMWGQHIAFGQPFLEEGAVIDAPTCEFIVHEAMAGYEPRRFQPDWRGQWPIAPSPVGGQADASQVPAFGSAQHQEMAYLAGLTEGWYAITNPVRRVGFALRFDPSVFRYIWYWQQLGNVATGYPWWSRLHATALEPWTSYPTSGLEEAVANGSAWRLSPGETLATQFSATAYDGLERVHAVTVDGDVA